MNDNPAEYVSNDIAVRLREDQPPSVIVNGVEIAGMIDQGARLEFSLDGDGLRSARLFVTFPVILP